MPVLSVMAGCGSWDSGRIAQYGIAISSFYFLVWPRIQERIEYSLLKLGHEMQTKKGLEMMREVKSELFSHMEALPRNEKGELVILELGISYGANLKFYPSGSRLIASDIHSIGVQEITEKCEKQGLVLSEYVEAPAEDLNRIADNSVSAVVTTHVTCSMAQMDTALREINRVLMPGGKYYFLEHTREREGYTLRHIAQLGFFLPLKVLMYCNCRLDQAQVIKKHFDNVDIKHTVLPNKEGSLLIFALGPHVYGNATKE